MTIVLNITTPDKEIIEFPVLEKFTIGRSSKCDLTIKDIKMSGIHGSFEVSSKGKLSYKDLGSTNGSFLNNSKIINIEFKVNEVLKIGNSIIKIDEKKLSSKERISIGRGTESNENSDFLIPEGKNTKSIVRGSAALKNEKPKYDKSTSRKSEVATIENEAVIEQEKSSGLTKQLKLEKSTVKKK